MTIIDELQLLAKFTKDCSKKLVAKQIRRVGKEEGEMIYQIIMLLVREELDRGYSKKYLLRELLKKLPWEKSRLIERLQEVVGKGVLKHEKRKYLLNKEDELVKRIWNYYNNTSYQEDDKIEAIRKLKQKKKELEMELEEKEWKSKKRYRETSKKEEKEYREKIKEYLEEGVDPKEFIRKNFVEALGYKKI